MKSSARRKVRNDNDLSPRERRELIARGEYVEEEEEERGKAPLFLRMVAMGAMLVIVFACGYGLMSLVFKWMDSRNIASPANLASTAQDTENLLAAAKSADTAAVSGTETVTLSIPDGGAFATRDIRCNSGVREDVMQQAVSAYMDALKESKQLDPAAQAKNIFQSGDWLYLNVNRSFIDSIKALDAEKATYIVTGLVRTLARNFPPVNKVKFYVEGKEIKDKKPIDLTMPWSLKGS